jgi:CheY-like chemotaxis protein
MNLAVNARDAMPNGGRLTITTEAVSYAAADQSSNLERRVGCFNCLSVSDTGNGISPDILPHIFEPFFTTKEVGKGTGLGLSTVYGIMKQHGGWVEVDTSAGRGTTFRLFLPAIQASPAPTVENQEQSERLGNDETILLVEDDPAVLQMAASVLKARGYRVLEANSGPSALKLWDQHHKEVDLLLTDIVMPGMSGWEVINRLRRENPRLKAVATSGYAPEQPRNLEVAFLPKPYQPKILLRTLEKALLEPPVDPDSHAADAAVP